MEPSRKSGAASRSRDNNPEADADHLREPLFVVTWSSFCQLIRPSTTSAPTAVPTTTPSSNTAPGGAVPGGSIDVAQLATQDETNLLAKHRCLYMPNTLSDTPYTLQYILQYTLQYTFQHALQYNLSPISDTLILWSPHTSSHPPPTIFCGHHILFL